MNNSLIRYKNGVYILVEVSFLNFNYLVSVTAGGQESTRAHVAKFYGRLQLIRSVLRASIFRVLKSIEIVILWV